MEIEDQAVRLTAPEERLERLGHPRVCHSEMNPQLLLASHFAVKVAGANDHRVVVEGAAQRMNAVRGFRRMQVNGNLGG